MNYRRVYSKKVAKFDIFTKEFRELLKDLKTWIRNGFRSKTIWIGPVMPSKKTTIYKIASYLNLSIRQKKSPTDKILIWFDDQTKTALGTSYLLSSALNFNCVDISKKNVEKIQEEVFGYGMSVDPKTHIGYCVCKSDENAKHDGRIIQCPTDNVDDNKVYQVVIDNHDKNRLDVYFDYRVCVMGCSIPVIYKKYKTLEKRFTNDTFEAEICAENIIPQAIQNLIIQFCQKIQCDFCELDVLQDQNSGKWFVIDVNKTPYGPPASLPASEKKKAVALLSNGFRKSFLQLSTLQ